MPELPEVETVRSGLNKLIVGKTFVCVKFDWQKSFPNNKHDVDGFLKQSKIKKVIRRGKVLIIELNSGYSLMIHLKMTGQLVFVDNNERFGAGHPNQSLIDDLPDKTTRVTFEFKDGSKLYFNDQRKFGWVKLLPSDEVFNEPLLKTMGPEPLEGEFEEGHFIERVKNRSNSNIKALLLDQKMVAGIGNIYADETLFLSGIHPKSAAGSIDESKLSALFHNIQQVLRGAIKQGGSSDKNYIDALGQKGGYLNRAWVFRREGEACRNCPSIIEKIRVAGRGTHVCNNCQELIC